MGVAPILAPLAGGWLHQASAAWPSIFLFLDSIFGSCPPFAVYFGTARDAGHGHDRPAFDCVRGLLYAGCCVSGIQLSHCFDWRDRDWLPDVCLIIAGLAGLSFIWSCVWASLG